MIRILSTIGRATLVVAAILVIVGTAVAGYFGAEREYGVAVLGHGSAIGALIGLVIGIITAGVVFGPLATLYDIRDNVRLVVELAEDEYGGGAPKATDRQGPVTTRREPRLR
jgi:hypothetical protein